MKNEHDFSAIKSFFNLGRKAVLLPLLLLALTAPLATNAQDAAVAFDMPSQEMAAALNEFSVVTEREIVFDPQLVIGLDAPALQGEFTPQQAIERLLAGTGLVYRPMASGAYAVVDPDAAALAGQNQIGQRQPGIEEIIVTGQKREERIQDVPIAISAFSMEDLEAQKLEGGFDLVKAIPNVSFTKTNFTSYNFQIRGVGTQAVSATTDPGVAVAFNNSAIIQNRLFEQEYLDVERVEVLRGPQGTLYGRNATAGVINVISNKPELGVWDGMLDVEVGNYNTRRLRGMFNMPIGDTFAVRGAYASTIRDGYTFNSGTGNQIDGRDLWTGRLSLRWQPTDRFRADLIYERFEEDDDRLRTGKQLCHRDPGPEAVGDAVIDDGVFSSPPGSISPEHRNAKLLLRRATFSQGCQPGSLYSDSAFGTPNGLSLPFILVLNANIASTVIAPGGDDPLDNVGERIIDAGTDPYASVRQSRDLREINSVRDPVYSASADLFELNVDFDVTPSLTLSSQTAYVEDETYSFQDFNRFNTVPIFTDTTGIGTLNGDFSDLSPGGVFCDPQIGCTDKIAGFDISQASAEQFNQEFRLQSSFDGPINFSVGANYTEFESLVDYYIMFNVFTALAWTPPFNIPGLINFDSDREWDRNVCHGAGYLRFAGFQGTPAGNPEAVCPYVDPSPLNVGENFQGDGHNYFRSKNPYELESWAGFGELYWNIREDLKLTVGLRYTDDEKTFIPVPSQLLLAPGLIGGGTTARGYPEDPPIEQNWGEWTGRLVLDWQPVLNFTDETLIYGSFSRGYKGGGVNPPTPGFATREEILEISLAQGSTQGEFDFIDSLGLLPILELKADEYDRTFKPEFVNAYEIGTKNTLFGGAMTLNATAFYYDYTDYQVSQIRDRTAVNENFDSEMWGLELETVFAPSPNWQFLANVGYLKTKIAEGETSIDLMNRTQGNPDYTLAKPWVGLPSNCVVPTPVAERFVGNLGAADTTGLYYFMCGVKGLPALTAATSVIDPNTGQVYDPLATDGDGELLYPEINGGAGLLADLGGNELSQSPNLTVSLGGQYSFDVTPEWRGTVRMDYYWQDESYHRVYNTEPYDRLKSWSNTNLSFWVNNQNSGITVEAYVKNLFNQTPITGAFLNSDDTGLTTNVFMFDPRLIGVSIRKEW